MYGFLQDDNFSVYKYIKLDRYIYIILYVVFATV